MNFLEKLLKNLKSISHESASYFDFEVDPLLGLKNEKRKISSWMNQISNTKPSDRDIRDALLSFRINHGLQDGHHARLACWGTGTRFDDNDAGNMTGYIIIEDETGFPLFLSSVDSFITDPKSYRRCYRGLLAGYFGYDPEGKKSTPAGRKNWELLRRYLEKRLDHVRIQGTVTPEWVSVITEHRNLLSDNPCERYGKGFLDGEQAELDLSASLWVSREIFRARFSAASECSDKDFLNYLPKLLNMLEDRRYSGFLDKGCPSCLIDTAPCL